MPSTIYYDTAFPKTFDVIESPFPIVRSTKEKSRTA